MTTTQLECFVQAAQTLNFRQAADELHLSQPTVSKQIASLERELGSALFLRTTRQVALTPFGGSFLRDAREILRLTYAAEERARHHATGLDLTVAYSDPNELMHLEPVLDRLRREVEGLHVLLAQGPRDENVARLEREQVDVVMGFESALPSGTGVRFAPLATCGLSCIVRADSSLSERKTIGPDDVTGLPQVLCLPPGMRRRAPSVQGIPEAPEGLVTHCANTSEAYCLVDSGFGYALVPAIYSMPDPFHRVIPWEGGARATYGLYHRVGHRGGLVPTFAEVSASVYGQPGFARPLPETWDIG